MDNTDSQDPPSSPWNRGSSSIAYEILMGIAIAIVIILLLFTISGTWPPFVAITSNSMEPHMSTGDLVFVVEQNQSFLNLVHDTGIVTYTEGLETNYRSYGTYGEVIVFHLDSSKQNTPIIHRAMLWVEEGENWYDRANKQYVGDASNCSELPNCPAPNDGFITKGDANSIYDQAANISKPVESARIKGTAEIRIPWLGWFQSLFI